MKRIFTSASAVGIGVLGLCNVDAQDQSDLWSFRAKLRGFYDDNYGTLNSDLPQKDDSFGFEFNPVGTYTVNNDGPTTYSVEYDYRLRYFEGRGNNQFDNQHLANLSLQNTPTDRIQIDMSNRFAFAQEPGVNEAVITQPVRTQGSYFRNNFDLEATFEISDVMSFRPGYNNRITDFQQDGVGSRSALLDSMQNQVELDTLWRVSDRMQTVAGLAYIRTDYTSDDPIGTVATGAARTILPEERSNNTGVVKVGVEDYQFSDVLRGQLVTGFQYVEFFNAPAGVDDTILSPMLLSLLTYDLSEDARGRVGLRYDVSGTDVALNALGVANTVQASKTLTFHGDVDYRISGPLSARLVWQMQHFEFEGGFFDGSTDQLYTSGLTFAYNLMQGLDLETGYLIDRLDSDIPARSFTRHRGFIGLNYSY